MDKTASVFDGTIKKNIRGVPYFSEEKIREFDLVDLELQIENLTKRKEKNSHKGEINIAMLLEYLEKVIFASL